MPILFGILASLFVGVSDSFGRASSRRADSVSHVSTQMLVGAVISFPAAFAFGSTWIPRDVLSGVLSGVLVASGLALVYRGMAESSAAIVSPTAAVLGALLPLGWDLAGGTELVPLAAVGCGVAVLSLALTTFNPDLGDRVMRGMVMAIGGGILFGLAVVFVADTSEASGVWPAASQRLGGFAAMLMLAQRRGVPAFLPPTVRRFGVLGGIAGAFGMMFWVIGGQRGDLGTVSVVASTYPAVVALLSTIFDGDQIRWWQGIGIGGAVVGTALIAFS